MLIPDHCQETANEELTCEPPHQRLRLYRYFILFVLTGAAAAMTTSRETTRTERDSLGEVQVPEKALYGPQTQRAVDNFQVSGQPMPPDFIHAIARIKKAAARANQSLELISDEKAEAIVRASEKVLQGRFPGTFEQQFPIDVYQTGSGTSTNMNVNEVIARLVSLEGKVKITANDHVNMGQSSNDVIPSAIHIATAGLIHHQLIPALNHLISVLDSREKELRSTVKTGRTHLMDAMPVTFSQEISGWKALVHQDQQRLQQTLERLYQLALGGTAVGTGTNTHPEFALQVSQKLSEDTGLPFIPATNFFAAQSVPAAALELSSNLRSLATTLTKIASDLRWMNSGPLAGLGEIELPALQPGSSIMPGKVNPVICESVLMAAAQVTGLDTAIALGAQSGNFELNVMLPMIGNNLVTSLNLSARASQILADKALAGFRVKSANIDSALHKNPVLVTALNPVIGYMKAAEIAKQAYYEQRPILDVAREKTGMSEAALRKILDPMHLTKGGISH